VTDAFLLGVDGGGTSTEAWISLPGGMVLGRGRAGPSNARAVGNEVARKALGDAIAAAFADARLDPAPAAVACFGLAGFDRPEERALLTGWVHDAGWADRLLTANDGDLVVAAGTPEGWGVGVIAGTGSIAVGRDREGRKARAGGWGHLIGDEGSAYAVVIDALRIVARRADGRESPPATGDRLAERLGLALGVSLPALIPTALYAPGYDRARIAGLAPEVIAASREDPEAVTPLLEDAGRSLAEQVVAVARALDLPRSGLPLALAGGFLLSADVVSAAMIHALTSFGYGVITTSVPDPVRGALVIAERALAGLKPH
jgi:N-acetylglucosamine kinase-like BadF-type ATPase